MKDCDENLKSVCLIDIGCTAQMFKENELSLNLYIDGKVGCANRSNSKIAGKGKVKFCNETSDRRFVTI